MGVRFFLGAQSKELIFVLLKILLLFYIWVLLVLRSAKMGIAKIVQKIDEKKCVDISSSDRNRANKVIGESLKKFHHHRLSWILPFVSTQVNLGHFPHCVLDVLLERLQHQRDRNDLSMEEIVGLEAFKVSQKQHQ